MARYLHLFENENDYNAARLNDYKEPWVSATNLGGGEATPPYRVDYNKSEYEKLLETPLTFEIVCGGTLYWYNSGNTGDIKTIEYKLNDGEWTEITSSKDNDGSGTTIATVITGDIIKFRGNNDTYCNFYANRCSCFRNTSDCYFYAYGNIMSLINYNNFKTNKNLIKDSTFAYLFNNTGIMSHPVKKLLLPATTLVGHCYRGMFQGCTSLANAPELPATALTTEWTRLAAYCYRGMFQGCTSLEKAPELPATTLSQHCYEYMFADCTSLVNAPELPATALADYCYDGMFRGCTSLVNAPELPATALANDCYQDMFWGCTSLVNAPELPATALEYSVYQSMFHGCTSLVNAPELPATTLTQECYRYMFSGCTSLVNAPTLPATTLVLFCYGGMFQGCTSLNYIKCLATDIPDSRCTQEWVSGVASTGTFVKNASMASWTTGTSGIPTGWTVQDATN